MQQKRPPIREMPGETDLDPVARAAELAALGLRARLPAGALVRLTAASYPHITARVQEMIGDVVPPVTGGQGHGD